MRISLKKLRVLVSNVIKEVMDSPTISSDLDPGEKEFSQQFPKWGSPQSKKIKHDSPAEVKAKQVAALLQKKGITQNAEAKKKVTHELLPFIEKMDPTDIFISSPEEIAQQFVDQVLKGN